MLKPQQPTNLNADDQATRGSILVALGLSIAVAGVLAILVAAVVGHTLQVRGDATREAERFAASTALDDASNWLRSNRTDNEGHPPSRCSGSRQAGAVTYTWCVFPAQVGSDAKNSGANIGIKTTQPNGQDRYWTAHVKGFLASANAPFNGAYTEAAPADFFNSGMGFSAVRHLEISVPDTSNTYSFATQSVLAPRFPVASSTANMPYGVSSTYDNLRFGGPAESRLTGGAYGAIPPGKETCEGWACNKVPSTPSNLKITQEFARLKTSMTSATPSCTTNTGGTWRSSRNGTLTGGVRVMTVPAGGSCYTSIVLDAPTEFRGTGIVFTNSFMTSGNGATLNMPANGSLPDARNARIAVDGQMILSGNPKVAAQIAVSGECLVVSDIYGSLFCRDLATYGALHWQSELLDQPTTFPGYWMTIRAPFLFKVATKEEAGF